MQPRIKRQRPHLFPALGCSHKSRGRHVEPTEKSPIKKGSVSYPRVQPITSHLLVVPLMLAASRLPKKKIEELAQRERQAKRAVEARSARPPPRRQENPRGIASASRRPRRADAREGDAGQGASERARGWRRDERSEADSDGSVAPSRGARAGQPCRPLHRWCWISLETTGPGTSRGTRARAGTDDAFGREDVSSCYPRREEQTGTR